LRPLLTVIRFSSIDAVLPQSVAQVVHRQDNLALVLLVALIRSDCPKSSHGISTAEWKSVKEPVAYNPTHLGPGFPSLGARSVHTQFGVVKGVRGDVVDKLLSGEREETFAIGRRTVGSK
jgi:hypothetical protein